MRDREGERKRIHYHFLLLLFFFNKSVLLKNNFIYLVSFGCAASLHSETGLFSSCGEQGLLSS